MKSSANYLSEVKEQYEDYPYPPRDPQDEKLVLKMPDVDMPERLNHYCFEGQQTFTNGFRILVAGAGTGDSTIYLAEQYGVLGAEIVHLDLSSASIAIAQERARIRGIDEKITFLHASLLDVPTMGLGKFDYISCIGVLHHLKDPEEGLAALASALSPKGAMAIMVYGQYGRHAIYPMQETFRLLLKHVKSRADKIKCGRELFSQLPATNWYQFSKHLFMTDYNHDNSFFDLLLHPQDRAYTVPQLYEFVVSAGLKGFSLQHNEASGTYMYDPRRLLNSPRLLQEIDQLSLVEQQAMAELLCGDMTTHTFYAALNEFHEPDPNDENYVPCVTYDKHTLLKAVMETAIASVSNYIAYRNPNGGQLIMVRLFPTTAAMMLAIDGTRTIAEIINIITARSDFTHEQVKQHFLDLYADLRKYDLVFLRHSSVPPFANPDMLQQDMKKRMGYA